MSVFIGYPSFMAYQMMKGKKGNNDGFPSIPGMIARYSALGLTNEQMAANPVWVDKTGNGHDLQMKNFAWKEGSGISDVYPGFILGDGVDDEAVTKNNLDLEDTYTVYTPLILLKYGGVVCGKSAAKDYSLNTVISSKSIGFDSANALGRVQYLLICTNLYLLFVREILKPCM